MDTLDRPNIIEKLKIKTPRFPKKYEYIFAKYARKGTTGKGEADRIEKAKIFRNNYELYMYAFFLGVRNKARIKISSEVSIQNVMRIIDWKPLSMNSYIMACALAEDGTPFRDYDLMDEKELDEKSKQLRVIIEEFTNGGLGIIDEKFNDDPAFFTEQFAFTNFVFE